MKKSFSIVITITLMLLASALTCLIMMLLYSPKYGVSGNENYESGQEFTALLEKIEEMYIGEYDSREVSSAAMRAAVDALGDRWSYYLTPEEYAEFSNSINNQFAGIGVVVVIDEETGGMAILHTYRGSPAEEAGLTAGDIVIAIDGESVAGLDLDRMRDLLSRPLGETVDLSVLKADGTVTAVSVTYDLVFTDPILYEMLEGSIGYISIANFEGSSADGFIAAVGQLLEQGAQALIFDVRGNGGGMVYEMTRMLDFLLPEGEVFVSVDRDGKEDITWSDADMIDVPAVVIVDRFSFSAAEYFAATLKEYGYADIVGEQTTGKSRSQRTIELPGGGALHISTSQYLTKNRVALFDVGGLVPDYPLVLSDEDFADLITGNLDKENDPQLKLAIDVIRNSE